MKAFRNVVLAAGMLALSGCTAFNSFSEVDALNEAQAVGSPFTQALANEYREFANRELKEMFDYPDALHFARKGLAAASGETVMPEPVSDWNLSANHIQELSAARGRLVTAFDLGARENAPAAAARAQAKFDCWIEQQEENWQDNDIAECKNLFSQAMNELEGNLQPPPVMPEVIKPISNYGVNPSAPMETQNAMYLVFFDWDSYKVGSGGASVIDAVAGEVSKNPPNGVSVVGHSDTSGPKQYNQRLAFKRANAVKDALVQRGVSADMISVDARGEEDLLVPTADNVREPANRRANISFN